MKLSLTVLNELENNEMYTVKILDGPENKPYFIKNLNIRHGIKQFAQATKTFKTVAFLLHNKPVLIFKEKKVFGPERFLIVYNAHKQGLI